MIKYLRNATNTQMLWSIYFAYFQSKLRYGIIFWGREGKTVQIFRIQKKVIRLIVGAKKCESCKPLFRELQILTLASMYILEVLCFTKKYQGYIWQNMDIHNHNTRRKLDLHIHHCNTVLYQRSVTNMGIKLFNKLPTQIRQLPSYKIFKREVKKSSLTQCLLYTWKIFAFWRKLVVHMEWVLKLVDGLSCYFVVEKITALYWIWVL